MKNLNVKDMVAFFEERKAFLYERLDTLSSDYFLKRRESFRKIEEYFQKDFLKKGENLYIILPSNRKILTFKVEKNEEFFTFVLRLEDFVCSTENTIYEAPLKTKKDFLTRFIDIDKTYVKKIMDNKIFEEYETVEDELRKIKGFLPFITKEENIEILNNFFEKVKE